MEKNKKNFLDKVVEFLVKDTKVDYDSRELFFPFTLKKSLRQNSDNSTPFHKILFNKDSVIPRDGFMEYIDEMYGVNTIEEISYVWGKYKDVMRYNVFGNDPTNEPIYESEKGSINEDSRQDLIDKVDERVKKYLRPYSHRQSMYNTGANYDFNNYCQEVFSIYDEGEQLYVWERYRKLLEFKMRNMMINESDDKKQKYLNKILEWFVRDTIINYETGIIYYPFSSIGPTGKRLPSYFDNLRNKLSMTFPSDIHIYCRDTYGLNPDETKYIWDEYKKIIRDRYDKETMLYHLGKPINESDDKKQVYLNKIIDWLVSDTDMSGLWFNPPYKTGLIYAENSITLTSLYKQTFNLLKYVTDEEEVKFVIQMNYFKRFCKEQYGLTEEETMYVWEQYMKNLHIKENSLINESDDKKQEYLNKVVDWLVRDTEIGNGYWFSPPYYYPGSMAGRTGFRSVYEHTLKVSNYSTYEHFDSGLASQLIYFKPYCLNNYGLTEDEIDYVWKEYMEKLYESNNWGF